MTMDYSAAEAFREVRRRMDEAVRWIVTGTGALAVAAFSSAGIGVWSGIHDRGLAQPRTWLALAAAAIAISGAIGAIWMATSMAGVTIVEVASHRLFADQRQVDGLFSAARMAQLRQDYAAAWETYLDEARAAAHDHAAQPDLSHLNKAHSWLLVLHSFGTSVALANAAREMDSRWRALRLRLTLTLVASSVGTLMLIYFTVAG